MTDYTDDIGIYKNVKIVAKYGNEEVERKIRDIYPTPITIPVEYKKDISLEASEDMFGPIDIIDKDGSKVDSFDFHLINIGGCMEFEVDGDKLEICLEEF